MGKITLENIVKVYGSQKKKDKKEGIIKGKRAVDNVSFEIPEGSFTVLVGPSGCGKTTLLRMIAGLEEITAGNINLGDVDITHLAPGDRGLAMVFQNYALYPHMSVRENIEFGLVNARIPKREIIERVDWALEIVGLEEYASRRPANLSGGQRQRVALARAISKMPQCFLMDEPLSNLDAKLRSEMRAELIRLHEELKSTFVYVTHDQVEAMTMGDNIIVMSEGVIRQQGTPVEIHNNPNCVFVAKFIGDPGMNIIDIGEYKLGFRPREVHFEKPEEECMSVTTKLVSFENHGSEYLYLCESKNCQFYIKEFSKHRRDMKSELTLYIKKEDICVFDSEEMRVYDEYAVRGVYEEFKQAMQ